MKTAGKFTLSAKNFRPLNSFLENSLLGISFAKQKTRRIMKGIRKGIFAVGTILLLLNGCQAMTGKTAGQNVDDATINAAVKSRLVADKASNLVRVDVDTSKGVVSLNGVVDSPETKERAEELARGVSSVKNVINNLQVSKG